MTGRRRAALAGTAVLVAVLFASSAQAAARLPSGSYFALSCTFSHSGPLDPIVYPRLPNRSHDHAFIGNVSTNAFSTASTLRNGSPTTCSESANASASWATCRVGRNRSRPSR